MHIYESALTLIQVKEVEAVRCVARSSVDAPPQSPDGLLGRCCLLFDVSPARISTSARAMAAMDLRGADGVTDGSHIRAKGSADDAHTDTLLKMPGILYAGIKALVDDNNPVSPIPRLLLNLAP